MPILKKNSTGGLTSTRLVLAAAFLVGVQSSLVPQSSKPPNPSSSINADKGFKQEDDSQLPSSLADEMRAKREIKFAEKEYQQNVSRAQEASGLARDLAFSVKKKNSLGREEIKKLDKLEKLIKQIRNEAGGSDNARTVEKTSFDLPTLVNCVAELSTSLSDKVQKTPRQVISAAAIDEANVLLELIRLVRNLTQ